MPHQQSLLRGLRLFGKPLTSLDQGFHLLRREIKNRGASKWEKFSPFNYLFLKICRFCLLFECQGRNVKMSVIDILFRVADICKKYEKYDIDKQREQNAFGDDAFARLYASIEAEIEKALQKSERSETETNRAAAVAMNAEVRRTKAKLIEEIPKLQKLAMKKVKGLLKEDMEARCDLVMALPDRIRAISDGVRNAAAQEGCGTSTNHIKFDTPADGNFDAEFFQQSEESSQFRQEYEMRRMKQDEGLDVISQGLDTLKELAHDMNEELDRQVPLMDEIETKVDRASADLKNTNVRLKETLFKVRSTRNFMIDIILLCVLLGIVMYLYNVLKE